MLGCAASMLKPNSHCWYSCTSAGSSQYVELSCCMAATCVHTPAGREHSMVAMAHVKPLRTAWWLSARMHPHSQIVQEAGPQQGCLAATVLDCWSALDLPAIRLAAVGCGWLQAGVFAVCVSESCHLLSPAHSLSVRLSAYTHLRLKPVVLGGGRLGLGTSHACAQPAPSHAPRSFGLPGRNGDL